MIRICTVTFLNSSLLRSPTSVTNINTKQHVRLIIHRDYYQHISSCNFTDSLHATRDRHEKQTTKTTLKKTMVAIQQAGSQAGAGMVLRNSLGLFVADRPVNLGMASSALVA